MVFEKGSYISVDRLVFGVDFVKYISIFLEMLKCNLGINRICNLKAVKGIIMRWIAADIITLAIKFV